MNIAILLISSSGCKITVSQQIYMYMGCPLKISRNVYNIYNYIYICGNTVMKPGAANKKTLDLWLVLGWTVTNLLLYNIYSKQRAHMN